MNSEKVVAKGICSAENGTELSSMRGFVLELRSFEADIVPVFVADKSPEQRLSNSRCFYA